MSTAKENGVVIFIRGMIYLTIILFFLVPCDVNSFMRWGKIDKDLAYKNFEILPDASGYTFTLVNKAEKALVNTYIVIYGMDIQDRTVYRYDLYVKFVEGGGTYSTILPPSDEELWDLKFEIYKNFEPDNIPFG